MMRQWVDKPTSREAATGAYYDGVILRATEEPIAEDTERQHDAVVTLQRLDALVRCARVPHLTAAYASYIAHIKNGHIIHVLIWRYMYMTVSPKQ